MFTGIVEEIGTISAIHKTWTGACLKLKSHSVYRGAKSGDSIAMNGVCLSVTDIKGHVISFDVIEETLKRTTLGRLKVNDYINLERSLRADSRMGGHFVSGHVDYEGRINEELRSSDGAGFKISLPVEFSKFVVEKGSITLDGVSLTVAEVKKEYFAVYLIPHTLKVTTLGKKKKGDLVNIETDLLAKYLVKQTQKTDLNTLLKKYDYIK
ncbi:riboflavin synthase [Candidatus Omnitrophota bacterium]